MIHEGVVWVVVIVLIVAFFRLTSMIQNQRFYLRLLDKKLDSLLKHQGVEWTSLSPEVQRLAITPGKKIAAIKLLREENPELNLREAMTVVEDFSKKIR